MTTEGFTITSWQELAILISIVAAIAGVLGGVVKSQIDRRASDAAAQDRIIRLIEVEAEKRVEVVRTEFKLQIAEMQLAHRTEIDAMKSDFEKQLHSLKREHSTYRCELAPICAWRNSKTPPPPPVTA